MVSFDDEESTAIIPGRLVEWKYECRPTEGDVVNVMWSDGKQYSATFIYSGVLNSI